MKNKLTYLLFVFLIYALSSCNPYKLPDFNSELIKLNKVYIGMGNVELDTLMNNELDQYSVPSFTFEYNGQKYECKVADIGTTVIQKAIYHDRGGYVYKSSGYSNSNTGSNNLQREDNTSLWNPIFEYHKVFFVLKDNIVISFGFPFEYKSSPLLDVNNLGLAMDKAYSIALKNRK